MRPVILRIEKHAATGEKAFLADACTQDAVMYNLAMLGDLAKRLPKSVKTASPLVNWKDVGGLRQTVVHQYDDIDLSQIWKIVSKSLPIFKKTIEKMLKELGAH